MRYDGHEQIDQEDLLTGLKAGDEDLFRRFVTELSPMLTRLARTYTATDQAAQDAVQDTWLTVLDKLDSFEGRSSLSTWVCGVLVNKARRSGVRAARTIPFSSAWSEDRAPAVAAERFRSRRDQGATGTWAAPPVRWDEMPEDRLAESELRRVIDLAIQALPPRQREVVTAHDVLGMPSEEVCELFGLTVGNQRVLLHRARSRIRTALELYAVETEPPASTENQTEQRTS